MSVHIDLSGARIAERLTELRARLLELRRYL
jgi:hypothetical protein